MKLTRSGVTAVLICAAFFAGSVVTMAVAGDNGGAQAAKKKKAKRGPRGPQGPPGPTNVVMREKQGATVNPGQTSATTVASCNPGEEAVGGGVVWDNSVTSPGQRVVESYPNNNNPNPPVSWAALVENGSGGAVAFRVRVICAS
jgi:hypothetical protein